MALRKYGVLRGRAIGARLGAGRSPHYQVHIIDGQVSYRIAVNVQSKLSPSELEYVAIDHFRHPILHELPDVDPGFSEIESKPGGIALDYIRGNLFDPRDAVALAHSIPGPDNDLNEKINRIVQRAMADADAEIFAFGERWGPEPERQDKYFGFLPGNGIHDIHMNQGNVGRFVRDDGVWQDGGLVFRFPHQGTWSAIFLKFQSQSWHTDESYPNNPWSGTREQPQNGSHV